MNNKCILAMVGVSVLPNEELLFTEEIYHWPRRKGYRKSWELSQLNVKSLCLPRSEAKLLKSLVQDAHYLVAGSRDKIAVQLEKHKIKLSEVLKISSFGPSARDDIYAKARRIQQRTE